MWACHKRQRCFFSILSWWCHCCCCCCSFRCCFFLYVYLRKMFSRPLSCKFVDACQTNCIYILFEKLCAKMCRIRAEWKQIKPLLNVRNIKRHKQTNVETTKWQTIHIVHGVQLVANCPLFSVRRFWEWWHLKSFIQFATTAIALHPFTSGALIKRFLCAFPFRNYHFILYMLLCTLLFF